MRDCCRPLLSLPLLCRELTHGVLKPLLMVVLVLWAWLRMHRGCACHNECLRFSTAVAHCLWLMQ